MTEDREKEISRLAREISSRLDELADRVEELAGDRVREGSKEEKLLCGINWYLGGLVRVAMLKDGEELTIIHDPWDAHSPTPSGGLH